MVEKFSWKEETSEFMAKKHIRSSKYQQLDIQQQALKLTANMFMNSSDFQVIPHLHLCSFPRFIGEVT